MPTVNRSFVPGAFALLIAVAAPVRAGPLNPPAGPIAPTAKPLAELEPRIALNSTNTPGDSGCVYRITAPGSYYLTGNVAVADKAFGIMIAADSVTIDLMGYELFGQPGSIIGILYATPGLSNTDVHNGSVRGWAGGAGIELSAGMGSRIYAIQAKDNGDGIVGGAMCTIVQCTAFNNTGHGIRAEGGGTISACACGDNAHYGIVLRNGGSVVDCAADANGDAGFLLANGATAARCGAFANTGNGFAVTDGCTVSDCASVANSVHGIDAGAKCTIAGNTAANNGHDGIVCNNTCTVLSNTCSANGAVGVHTLGARNRIEGNSCNVQHWGVNINAGQNVIVRNTCSGNAINWEIVPNNYYGPIIDRTGASTVGVSGNSAADTLASAHPNANFTY